MTIPHPEHAYLTLLTQLMKQQKRQDRTGTGVHSLFAPKPLVFNMENKKFPLLTTKKMSIRLIAEELFWFIRGETDGRKLVDKNVKIWEANGTEGFLKGRGIQRREHDLGPIYGFQWRHFGAKYKTCDDDYTGQGVDQLQQVIHKITNDPTDRRIIMSAWNPADLHEMALPPCHMFCQFYVDTSVTPHVLSLQMYQRSADMGLGVPFNIASYALFLAMMAHVTNTTPGVFTHVIGDAHVYADHIEPLKIQIEREPKEFPTLRINNEGSKGQGLKGLLDIKMEDLVIEGYEAWPAIKMKMSA